MTEVFPELRCSRALKISKSKANEKEKYVIGTIRQYVTKMGTRTVRVPVRVRTGTSKY